MTATCGLLWLILGPLGAWVPWAKPSGIGAYAAFIFAGLAVALWRNWTKKSVKITIPETDSDITVEVGDIFKDEGLKFIPVNEYFDCEIGDKVSEKSLHGQFIKRIMKMDNSEWWQVIKKGLDGVDPVQSDEVTERNQYRIGTTVRIKNRGPEQEYMLVVLSRTDTVTWKAKADLTDICTCARSICDAAREYNQGRRVDIPIIGSGLSNTGIPIQRLLDILILFVMYYTQKEKIAKHLRIVVSEEALERLDLQETKRRWEP